MEPQEARRELNMIREVLNRTHERVDPHALHFIWWGSIVLVWYPLMSYFARNDMRASMLPLSIGALVLGAIGSTVIGARLARKPRLEAQNTFIAKQIGKIVFFCIGAGFCLSAVAPWSGFVDGPHMPTVWALVYATMATMVGVVYTDEWLWSGLFIFASAVAAMFLWEFNGYIVGPAMGLGMIVPGVMAERRVASLRRASGVSNEG